MTTEVQALEAEVVPAVNAAGPSAPGARRLKRPGSSTAEDAGLKRPRTAPTTPIDTGANGPSANHAVPDLDVARAQDTGPPDNPTRPSAAASAPAALASGQQSQPAASIGTAGGREQPPRQGHGASGRQSRGPSPCDVGSGQPRHRLSRQHLEEMPGNSPHPQALSPLQSSSVARSGGGSRAGTPHSETHSHADPHHRHGALEEQVFSPSFHNHATSPASSAGATAGAVAGEHSPAAHGSEHQLLRSLSSGTSPAASVPVRSSHPHGTTCTQLHAIDLNVVEGVAADEEEGQGVGGGRKEGREAGDKVPAEEAPREQEDGAAPGGGGEKAAEQQRRPRGLGVDSTSSSSGDDLRAVDERLSSSDEGAADGEAEGESEEQEEGEEFPDSNDENTPVAGYGAAGQHRHNGPRHAAAAGAAGSGSGGQQRDAVLVASAPRNLTVSAAGAAAAAAEPGTATDADEAGGDDEELFLEFDPLLFIKQLPPLDSCVPPHRPALLPPLRPARSGGGPAGGRRKTLVLDLDETLVHSSLEPVTRADFSFPVSFNGAEHTVHVRQRPHLRDFMVRVSHLFEVVVFTASQRIYAERLLDILDPGQALVQHRIYRDSCVVVDGNYLKDLSVLGRELTATIIVDNSPQAFGFQVDNGIPIESWYDDDTDDELLRLLPFLETLAGLDVDDVRPLIRQQFRLQELIDRA